MGAIPGVVMRQTQAVDIAVPSEKNRKKFGALTLFCDAEIVVSNYI